MKRYPGVLALDGVSLRVRPGTVHALVGENGAGKSTLVKVITGAITPDAGVIEVEGRRVNSLTPRSARANGISVIHQERQIAGELSVAENVMLGQLPGRAGVSWRALRREATRLLDEVGVGVDGRRPVAGLSVAQLQGIEIARALAGSARVLVMDEPTSALGGGDVRRLFGTVRRLREQGVGLVYISHHLEEIFEVADEVTVLRDGRLVGTFPIGEVGPEGIVEHMLGRARRAMRPPERLSAQDTADRPVVIEARSVACSPALVDVSLEVRMGEVVCISGPVGSGRRELARVLAGVIQPTAGEVRVSGRRLTGPRSALRHGVAFLPEDRKRDGLLLELSIRDNVALAGINRGSSPLASPRAARRQADDAVRDLRIKAPSSRSSARQLSGGNQQKVLLARWLGVGADVFVFDEPTAGIDVGAKAEIYGIIRSLAADGATVVVFSSDFEEIRALAHRAIVLRRGRIAGELLGEAITEEGLLGLEWAA